MSYMQRQREVTDDNLLREKKAEMIQRYLLRKRAEKEQKSLNRTDLREVEDDTLRRSELETGEGGEEEKQGRYGRDKEVRDFICDPYEIPILNVEVNMGKGLIERIVVYEGEKPEEIAANFAKEKGKPPIVSPCLLCL